MSKKIQLVDEEGNKRYPVLGKRCVVQNDSSDATASWYKIAEWSISGTYTDRYIRMKVVSPYAALFSGILVIHTRTNREYGCEVPLVCWESLTRIPGKNITPNHFAMNYITENNILKCQLWFKYQSRYLSVRFEILSLEDRSKNSELDDEFIILKSYINVNGDSSLPTTGTNVTSTYFYNIGDIWITTRTENPTQFFGRYLGKIKRTDSYMEQ